MGAWQCRDGEQPGKVGAVVKAPRSSGLRANSGVEGGVEMGHLRERTSCLLESPKHTSTFLPSGPLDLAPISGKQKPWEDWAGKGKVPKWTPRSACGTLPAPNGSLSAPSWALCSAASPTHDLGNQRGSK